MSTVLEMEGGGRIKMWEEAGKVFFRCERELSRAGLYKVWIGGDGGELLLGTLVPEGGCLRLLRAMWPMELRRSGCWPVRSARCRMTYPFSGGGHDGWRWVERPQEFVDAETAGLGEWCPMLYYKGTDELCLAWPVRRDVPVPLAALFCLARSRFIRGELCLVWRFDAQGRPRIPVREEEEGKSRAR